MIRPIKINGWDFWFDDIKYIIYSEVECINGIYMYSSHVTINEKSQIKKPVI